MIVSIKGLKKKIHNVKVIEGEKNCFMLTIRQNKRLDKFFAIDLEKKFVVTK